MKTRGQKMTVKLIANKDNSEWTDGKYKIVKAKVSSRQDIFVFHCYFDTKYIAQRSKLEDAESFLNEHKSREVKPVAKGK